MGRGALLEGLSSTPSQVERAPASAAEVRAALGGLAPGEARVARVLLAAGGDVLQLTVSDVASAARVGVGTVVRACQRLGFAGFQAAKIALARGSGVPPDLAAIPIGDGDSPGQVLVKLAAASAQTLARTPDTVDAEALGRAVTLLRNARRVLLLGVGTSAPLAADAAYRFATVGVAASFPPDVHVQHVTARLLEPGDVAVVISHTGATTETVAAARGALQAGAQVVAVTSFSTSPLTELADVCLVAGGLETAHRVEAVTSRLAHLLVVDSLVVSLQLVSPRPNEALALTADVLAQHRY